MKVAPMPDDLEEEHVFLAPDLVHRLWQETPKCAACGKGKDLGLAFCPRCWALCQPSTRKALRQCLTFDKAAAWCRAFREITTQGVSPKDLQPGTFLWQLHTSDLDIHFLSLPAAPSAASV